MVGGPSIAFTHKADVDETHIHTWTNVCKSSVEIDDSQLYPYSMRHPMPTRLYTRCEFEADLQRVNLVRTNLEVIKEMVISFFQRRRPDCRIESFYKTGSQKKTDCFNADGFCGDCNTVFEAMGCFYPYRFCQEARTSLTEEVFNLQQKKREIDELRKHYIEENGYSVVEM